MVPHRLRPALKAAGFLAVYLYTCVFLPRNPSFSQAVLWLPTGVAIAGLWLLGWRYWPVVLLGTLVHRLASGYTFPTYLPATVGNSLEALTAVLLMRRLGFRQDFRRLRDGLILILVVCLAPMVSATIGRTSYMGHIGELSFFLGWAGWWRMNALGALVVVPLALSWAGAPRPRLQLGAVLEGLGMVGLAIGVVWFLARLDSAHRELGMVLSYLALPLALYAALRFGVRGAATAGAGIMIMLSAGASRGLGPFITSTPALDVPGSHEMALQALIAIVTTTPLLLAATIAEREAALARAAAERTRHEDLLASINLNLNDGLFRISGDRKLGYVNTAYARMLGYDSPDELLGKPGAELLADGESATALRRVLEDGGQLASQELALRRKDGSVLRALVSCTVVRGPDGRFEHFDGAISDLTGYKRLEEELRQTQKMEALGKLAGGVAHDFNNLLTVISGHAELLQESLPADQAGSAHADEIHAAAVRASRLTGQLLAYSRRQVLTPEVLDLRGIADQSAGMLRRLIGEDVELAVERAAEELLVRVDRGQMEQVVLNLVLNARDAMPHGGRIVLSTSRLGSAGACGAAAPGDVPAGPLAHLSVSDTGVGMSADVVRVAFDPFFTTKELGRGTGLGLSTVYGIVRQSGGAVWLESATGAGTTARVCLPLAAAPAEAPAPAPPPRPAPAAAPTRGTVLVVEDEPALRDLLAETLSRAGCTVLSAGDGEAALEVARRSDGALDLLLTDVVMPRMGGRELVARLAAERPGLRVLMISGYAWGPPDWTPPDGARVAFLQKPFAPSTLLERVRACLAAPARPRA
jgi:PAS domain S-box-containing protein